MISLFEIKGTSHIQQINKVIINILLIVALLTPSAPLFAASNSTSNALLHPFLEQIVQEQPTRVVRVIVQKLTQDNSVEEVTASLGGEVVRDLSIINAFVAKIPAKVLPQLAQADGVRWISPDSQVYKQNVSYDQSATTNNASISDGFDSVSYDGSNGTANWTSAWHEIGESDGPDLGNIAVVRFLAGGSQGVRLQGGAFGIERSMNLSTATESRLNIRYRRKNFETSSDYIQIELSSDGGHSWSEVGRLEGPMTDPGVVDAAFNLSSQPADTSLIRFVTSESFNDSARFYLDAVNVTYSAPVNTPAQLPFKTFVPLIPNSDYEPSTPEVEAAAIQYATSHNETVRDEFSSISFGGNNGSSVWDRGWQELSESNGPSNGLVKVVSSSYCSSANCMRLGNSIALGASFTGRGVLRRANLSGATSATLSFDYRRNSYNGSAAVTLEVTKDGGISWHPLAKYSLNQRDGSSISQTFDISAYASRDTQIRFIGSGHFPLLTNTYFYFDNIQINFNSSGSDNTSVSGGKTDTVGDDFDGNNFSDNSGSVNWRGNWIEDDPRLGGSGPQYGQVRVVNNALYLDDYPETLGMPSASRSVDMTGAKDATFSFDFRTTFGLDPSDTAVVEISSDGGNSYTILETFQGLYGVNSGSRSYDITPFISADTRVRFRIAHLYGGSNEYFIVDNVQIEFGCSTCIDDSSLVNTYNDAIGASAVWKNYPHLQGEGVGVAVVDSGIAHHPDFINPNGSSRIVAQLNFVDEEGTPDDFYGHGTHVAGIIGGDGGESNGAYIGVAPKVNLIDIKVTDDCGAGTTSDVIAGLQWVLENKDVYNIRIANLSINSSVAEPYYVSPLNAALEILWFNGIVVVVSAGNNGDDGVLYPPANDPFFISVGAVETNNTPSIWDDIMALFSAAGITSEGFVKPEIIVPGADIISALASDDSNLAQRHPAHAVQGADGNFYMRMSGTSMAAGVATGAIALLLQNEPHLTPDQVKYRLMNSAHSFFGFNYLDIFNAINKPTTESANTGLEVNELLWTGSDPVTWGSVNWNSVNWNSVNWNSVNWNSVNWNSVNWNSTSWDDGPTCSRPTPSAPSHSIDVRVSSATDDAEQDQYGFMDLHSGDLELVYDSSNLKGSQEIGLRFAGVEIPQGATITNAYIQFQVDETDIQSTNLTIYGEATDSASTFNWILGNISSRSKTAYRVGWQPAKWTSAGSSGEEQRTPDLTPIIQEIVDRAGWSQGNALAILINGSGQRTAESYDGKSSAAPLLHVEFRP